MVGHANLSSFALDWAKNSHRVASGGRDGKVLIWDLEDYESKLSTSIGINGNRELNSISKLDLKINFKQEVHGHTKSVEDITFSPRDRDILASVGLDRCLISWDFRATKQQIFKVLKF